MIEAIAGLATAFGLSSSAGLNAYIPLLTLALLARFTPLISLGEPWSLLTNGWIILLLFILLLIEIFADKIPAVDSLNDIIQTFIRPTAGAILFAATTQETVRLHPVLAMACGVILAGSVHAMKAGARPVLTATTGGVANPIVSTIEDMIATLTSFIAVIFPYLVLAWVALCLVLALWIVRRRRARNSNPRET